MIENSLNLLFAKWNGGLGYVWLMNIKGLMKVAEHEQIAVLQRCFYASNAQKQQRIKRILDIQKEMEARPNDTKAKRANLFLAGFFGRCSRSPSDADQSMLSAYNKLYARCQKRRL